MQTLTQMIGLVVPPGKNTVEFKIIFTKEDYDLARDLCLKSGDKLWEPLSETTPVADRLQDLAMMMYRLEQYSGAKEREWKPGFFKNVRQSHVEFFVLLNLRNYLENHSISLLHHNRSGKQMYGRIMDLLKLATQDENVRSEIINNTYEWKYKK